MRIAVDYNDNRVHIDDTQSNLEYYCPYCGTPLITRKGDIRQHHFAHKSKHQCSDTWEQNRNYDISDWHNEWQSLFPVENQEVKVALGETRHRTDVMIGKTVIEFQHSIMPVQAFDDRNNFYFNLGYKVIWLFDLCDICESGKIWFETIEDGLQFYWENPKKAFNSYDIQSGCIDLFFQVKSDEEKKIVRVKDVSEKGFESFVTTNLISVDSFLQYVGLHDGICLPPDRDDIAINEGFIHFKEEYHIELNKQQERALQSIEGHNLLLAVPGSGKTTVLVAKIGYMICKRGIAPESILAITYNAKATKEMQSRFSSKFGATLGNSVAFRTLNAFSFGVYRSYCKKHNHKVRQLIDDKERKKYIVKAYKQEHPDNYPTESDLLNLESAFSFIKNMMLSKEQILKMDNKSNSYSTMYSIYQEMLKNNYYMDFDDQMVFAEYILTHDTEVLTYYQKKYQYICVDEAQDTSKIQHKIIWLLSEKNNLFMVGDEDQSIYGFRAAYPNALLNFRYDYLNPYILRMERNYRSVPQIVELAQKFISKNKGRYEKNMTSERSENGTVKLIDIPSRIDQFKYLVNVAKTVPADTAFLFRDNESSVVLMDSLLRQGIPFQLKKPKMNFFNQKAIKDIISFLKLSMNSSDAESFSNICNKGILYIKKEQKEWTIQHCINNRISVFDAYEEQMQYVKGQFKDRATEFRKIMENVSNSPTEKAIRYLDKVGYECYRKQKHIDYGIIEILCALAEQEPDKKAFLSRLAELENLYTNGIDFLKGEGIILSTVHSSKGLEYDTVFMVDVYDGRFPSSSKNRFSQSKDNADGEQEERRLFYVGMTRAKNNLYFFNMTDRTSCYLDELFPSIVEKREKERLEKEASRRKEIERIRYEEYQRMAERMEQEQKRKKIRQREIELERIKKDEESKKTMDICYHEVRNKMNQQVERVVDHTGRRWVKCEECGEIKPETDFSSYGGIDHVNLGICAACSRKHRN